MEKISLIKKGIKKFNIILVFSILLGYLASCSLISKIFPFEDENEVGCITESTFYEADNKYEVVDSYMLDDGNYYYFYYLGTVDYVPLNISDAEGIFFNGKETEITFTLKSTNVESSQNTISEIVEDNVTLSTTTYTNASVSAEYKIFQGKIEAGINQNATKSIKNTSTESLQKSVTNENSFEKVIFYKFNKKDPVGYYFYTPVASMKVYEVVVYNPNKEEVVHMSTYTEYGASIPGLYYSAFSYISDLNFKASFDESKITEFVKPTISADSNVQIKLDANGGTCEQSEVTRKIGKTYANLPIPTRDKYTFKGWTYKGVVVNNNTIIENACTLCASWDLVTKAVYKTSGEIKFSHVSAWNPFLIFVPGMNGATSDKGIELYNNFDIDELKKQGYQMRIIVDYQVHRAFGAADGLKYKINFKSNGTKIVTFTHTIDNMSYESKHNVSNYVSLNNVSGTIEFNFETDNWFDCYIKDFVITIEFIK